MDFDWVEEFSSPMEDVMPEMPEMEEDEYEMFEETEELEQRDEDGYLVLDFDWMAEEEEKDTNLPWWYTDLYDAEAQR